jgi:hypothetical protein
MPMQRSIARSCWKGRRSALRGVIAETTPLVRRFCSCAGLPDLPRTADEKSRARSSIK